MRGYLNEQTKQIRPVNQIKAQKLGLPDYEVEQAYDGWLYLKGYAPEKPQEVKEEEVRAVRNGYLAETDKVMIADFPISEEERELYKAYRTYLRDYTKERGWWEKAPNDFENWKAPKETRDEQ